MMLKFLLAGMPAPETLKIALMSIGGYQAEFSVYVTGLHAEAKAKSFEEMSRKIVDESSFDKLEFQLFGTAKSNPTSQNEATMQLRVFAQAKTAKSLTSGRFLGPIMSNQLQGYPGLTANFDYRTALPKVFCTYFPGLVTQAASQLEVHFINPSDIGSCLLRLAGLAGFAEKLPSTVPKLTTMTSVQNLPKQKNIPAGDSYCLGSLGETVEIPLGLTVFSRSGDKGSNVNVGFFFPGNRKAQKKWEWLRTYLSTEKLRGMVSKGLFEHSTNRGRRPFSN
jgi:Acyclic terpene utilisation family protein AtuA